MNSTFSVENEGSTVRYTNDPNNTGCLKSLSRLEKTVIISRYQLETRFFMGFIIIIIIYFYRCRLVCKSLKGETETFWRRNLDISST